MAPLAPKPTTAAGAALHTSAMERWMDGRGCDEMESQLEGCGGGGRVAGVRFTLIDDGREMLGIVPEVCSQVPPPDADGTTD